MSIFALCATRNTALFKRFNDPVILYLPVQGQIFIFGDMLLAHRYLQSNSP